MRLKVYRAATVAQAMAEIRDALGLDALILSTSACEGGVAVTAALETDDEPGLDGDSVEDDAGPARVVRVEASAVPDRPDRSFDAAPPHAAWSRHNLPAELDRALREAPARVACARLFRFGALPLSAGGPPLMLVGPPGAGKTLSIAKLATRLVLDGLSPMVITADDQRAGAVEQLAGFTRLLGLTLIAATGPETLARALRRRGPDVPVLIDAPGLDLDEPAQDRAMRALLSASLAAPVLVMPAGADPLEAADLAEAHAALGVRHLLGTRLDRHGRLGGILAAARRADLVLTEAGIGSAVTSGLTPISADWLAHRLCPDPETPRLDPPRLLPPPDGGPSSRGSFDPEAGPQADNQADWRADHRNEPRIEPRIEPGTEPRIEPRTGALMAHIVAQQVISRPTHWKTLP